MGSSRKENGRRQRLHDIDTQLEEAKSAYKAKKRALKEKRKAIRREWTPEDQALRDAKRKAHREKREERRALSEPPLRPLLEEIGCSVNHGAGAALSVVALILLLMKASGGVAIFSAIVYGGCLILMFLMSCLYHAFRAGSTVKRVWRRFDYCSIYLLIGGTITPILLLFVGGALGIVLCAVMWALIATGITFVGVFGPMVMRGLHFALFFTIGWSAIVFLPRMWNTSPGLFWFILGGGLAYTLGMIPFVRKTRGAHFIWHFFVIAGAALQWAGIWQYVF